jgi:Uri superfamily endonuclease
MKEPLASESKINPDSGAYQLQIRVKKDLDLQVGSLGNIFLPKGRYTYTGSAMKNLKARINRHLRKDKIIRWHIDYLTTNNNIKIEQVLRYPSTTKQECQINLSTAKENGALFIIKGFGSSDCKQCESHLAFIPDPI